MAGGGAGTSTGAGGAFGSAVTRGAAGAAGAFGAAGPGARCGAVTTIGEAGTSPALDVIDIPTAADAPAINSAAIAIRIVAFMMSSVGVSGHLDVRRG